MVAPTSIGAEPGATGYRFENEKGRDRPQIAIEVVVSDPLLNRLDVDAGLGIQEVWVFTVKDATCTLHTLEGDSYEVLTKREVLPAASLERIAHVARFEEQHDALEAFRATHLIVSGSYPLSELVIVLV